LEQKVLEGADAVAPFSLSAYDEAIGFASCPGDPSGCPSIGWEAVEDPDRGMVLEVTHAGSSNNAGLILATDPIDVSDFADGFLAFDIFVVTPPAGDMFAKADCGFPCTSGDQNIGSAGQSGWETVELSVADLVAGGLDLSKVNTGIVVIPQIGGQGGTVYRITNVRWYVPE
jgi:hypothetical protein